MNKPVSVLLTSLILTGCVTRFATSDRIQLERQLKDLVEVDQIAANIPQGKYKDLPKGQWNNFKDSVFTAHNAVVEQIFNKYGFLGFDKVGKEGSSHFWLLVQHCDKNPAFQQEVLKAMDQEVKRKNANANNYAYLYDRVKVNAGEKQLFGTQVTYEVQTTGRAIPKIGLIDSASVDNLRRKYGLEPLKTYLNMMTVSHYEMNRERYQKMGIKEPQIY